MVGLKITNSLKSKLRSLNSYYCHNVLGKKKSFSLRKTNKQVTLIQNQLILFHTICSSVTLEVLIINCETDFVNFFIFNCLTPNINLFNLNCLTSNFCFLKNISSASKRELFFMDALLQFRVLKSLGKMMTCYLRDKNKFLRYCTLCTSILKCRFSTKGIELTWLILFEAVEIPQIQAPRFSPF